MSAVPSLPLMCVNLDLNLNDSESVILLFVSSLQYCHTLTVFE